MEKSEADGMIVFKSQETEEGGNSLTFSFIFCPGPQPWDGFAYIQGVSSLLLQHFYKHPQRFTQGYVS